MGLFIRLIAQSCFSKIEGVLKRLIRSRMFLKAVLAMAIVLTSPWIAFGDNVCDPQMNSNLFVGQSFTENNVQFTLGCFNSSSSNNSAGLITPSQLTYTPVSGAGFVGFTLSLTNGDFQALPTDPLMEATQLTDLYFSVNPLNGAQLFGESAILNGVDASGFVTSNALNWQFFPGGPPTGTVAQAWGATNPDGTQYFGNGPGYASLGSYGNAPSDFHSYAEVYLQTCSGDQVPCNNSADAVSVTSATVEFNTTPVPEPSSIVLLGTGALGILGTFYRERKSA